MSSLIQDLRYALRGLVKNPGFTAVAVLTLALAIGVNTTMFSVVNAVMLKPLPYEDPDRLVSVVQVVGAFKAAEYVLAPDFLEWRKQNRVFSEMAGYTWHQSNLSGIGEPVRVHEGQVTDGFLRMLGVRPIQGRDFLPEEDQPGRNKVVMLSHDLWQARYGESSGIEDAVITLNGEPCAVVGVLPRGFEFPGGLRIDLLRPKGLDVALVQSRQAIRFFPVIARLKPGVTIEHAKTELDLIQERIVAAAPEMKQWDISIRLLPLHERLVSGVRTALLVLMGAVCLVLLLACLNVGSLLLARAATRDREMSVRAALGAGRSRLLRQLLTESLLLASLGCALGVALAVWLQDLLLLITPRRVHGVSDLSLDVRVLIFSATVLLLTALLFGLFPSWRTARASFSESLRARSLGGGSGPGHRRFLKAVVVSEVALATVLLVGAGLLIQSFWRLRYQDLGFQPRNVLALSVYLAGPGYSSATQQSQFRQRVLDRVSALPGIESTAWTAVLPPQDRFMTSLVVPEGTPDPPPLKGPEAQFNVVTHDYFQVMQVSLLDGDVFTGAENPDVARVAVVNESFVRRFPSDSPVGMRFKIRRGGEGPWYTVVGVVGDAKNTGLDAPSQPAVFHSLQQFGSVPQMWLVARTTVPPKGLATAVVGEFRAVDPGIPVADVRTLDEHLLTRSLSQRSFEVVLLAGFAGLALVLAAVGTYGVVAFLVRQRTREVAVRLAHGARASDAHRLVLREALALACSGAALGSVGALVLGQSFSSLLHEVQATDLATHLTAIGVLIGIAVGAAYLPARRAAKVDPMTALRYD